MGEAYIELFSSSGCQDCDAVKKLLDQMLKQYAGVELEVVDIAEEASRAEEYGIISVPSIVINGEVHFTGEVPDPKKLEETIQKEIR